MNPPEKPADPARCCPVCGAGESQATLFLPNTIDAAKVTGFSYASRKTPEFMSLRLLHCRSCDAVYASDPPTADALAEAYHQAQYDSQEEAIDAAVAYEKAVQPVLRQLAHRGRALEIGTGTGIFLQCLKGAGFAELVGVEPSRAAIVAAPPERQAWIREGVFEEADFAPASFDLVCCFMTLEHVRHPRPLVESALRLLRPGGAFVAVVHDWRGPVNRLLGKRSPIVDIEHLQLFSPGSVRQLLHGAGYCDIAVQSFANRYAISYWLRLAPLPARLKSLLTRLLKATGLERCKLSFNVGNLWVSGFKRD